MPFVTAVLPPDIGQVLARLPASSQPIERARAVLGELALSDPISDESAADAVVASGARLVRGLVDAISGEVGDGASAHRQLARAWRLDRAGADLLRRALVLIADHELNVSTYVARAVASTGASVYAVVIAALSALSGRRHGGLTTLAEALLTAFLNSRDPEVALAERMRRAETLPGFGHPLYPEGDPRAAALLAALAGRGAALGLFLIGRSVGWIAHAIEHYATGQLIRPRARYVGPPPDATAGALQPA